MEIFDDGAISWTRPATQAEIDAAAGVAELRQQLATVSEQRDALLAALNSFMSYNALVVYDEQGIWACDDCGVDAKMGEPIDHEDWCPYMIGKAAIDLCAPKQVAE
jgi:hypothetical protein